MAAILDFQSERFSLFLDLQVTSILPMKFRVNWPSCSEEKVQNIFSTWLLGRPTWISDQNDFSYFWSKSHPDLLILPIKFWVNWPFCSEEQVQNRFSRWWLLWTYWISDQNNFSYIWSTIHPDTSYQVAVDWPFGSGEEVQNKFLKWWPSQITNWNGFSYFWSTSHPHAFYQVSSQLAFWFRRRREK